MNSSRLFLAILITLAAPSLRACRAPPAFEEIPKIDAHSHIFEDVPEVVADDGPQPDPHRQRLRARHRPRAPEADRSARRAAAGPLRPEPLPLRLDLRPDAPRRPGLRGAGEALARRVVREGRADGEDLEGSRAWRSRTGRAGSSCPTTRSSSPIYAFLAERSKPLLAHLAEPREAWLPLDPKSVHYGYYSSNPEWHLAGRAGFPSHAEIVAARDRVLERNPRLTVIGAHLGSLEHDVDELAKRLDRYPNFFVDCSARTVDLTRQPAEKVRAFLVRYQDRVLYGLDQTRVPEPQHESTAAGAAGLRAKPGGVLSPGLPVLRRRGRDGLPREVRSLPLPAARGVGEAVPRQRGEGHPGPEVNNGGAPSAARRNQS